MGNIDIRDLRDGKFLWIDKAALNLVSAKAGNRGVSVYSWLCYYANAKNQNCYPSERTLASHCNVCRRTIMRTIKVLETIGIVSIERKKGRRNVYKLLNAPVDKGSDTVVTGDIGGTGVVTSVSLPLVTPVSPKQELSDQDKKNKTNVCLSAELWITQDLPYSQPGKDEIAELASWCERLAGDVDLYRLLERYRKDKGYPPVPKVVVTLCRQFVQDKGHIKNAWGWFKKAIDGQMKQVLMDIRLREHERLKKEPANIGHLLSQIIPRRE